MCPRITQPLSSFMSRYLQPQSWGEEGKKKVPVGAEVQQSKGWRPYTHLNPALWTRCAATRSRSRSCSCSPLLSGFLVTSSWLWHFSVGGLATCAPGWCEEVWHSDFRGWFLSDTPSTRRYGAPCVIGKSIWFMSLTSDQTSHPFCCVVYWLFLQCLCVWIMLEILVGGSRQWQANHCQCCNQLKTATSLALEHHLTPCMTWKGCLVIAGKYHD